MLSYAQEIKTTPAGTECLTYEVWSRVNKSYIVKAISELMHELLAVPTIEKEENGYTYFRLATDDPSIFYTYRAKQRMLDYWHIDKQSLKKSVSSSESEADDALSFFLEMQQTFGVKPFTLTHFIEETYNTLYADASIHAKGRLSADALSESSYQTIEHQMDGHPWATVNKGRIGFSGEDLRKFAPESDQLIRLSWIAVHKSRATFNSLESLNLLTLLKKELGEETLAHFWNILLGKGLRPDEYLMMPVHEWQWDHKIVLLFAKDIASDLIVPLGKGEDLYTPQQSIRTFFNTDQPSKLYVKTAISILNTSVYRGLSPKKLKVAPRVTSWVKNKLLKDEYLNRKGIVLLGEIATIGYEHPHFGKIQDAPYHYHDFLGVIWRESAASYLHEGERLMTMASLLYVDDQEESFIGTLIKKSGLPAGEWINRYLEAYLSPVLHIFYKHNFFFSPHGENTILVMKDYVPARIIIKDYVEEIVLTQEGKAEAPEELRDILREIEDEYAPLFILSGIFDAVFRYLSNILHTYAGYPEEKFWAQVAAVIRKYQEEFPGLEEKFRKFDLFTPEFIRVCINRVRLLTYGYNEHTDIPVPEIAGTLRNPVHGV